MIKKYLIFASSLFLITGCASKQANRNMSDNEIELQLMEKRVSNLEQKLEKAYSRLSIIQFTVDSHDQMLKGKNAADPALQSNEEKSDIAEDTINQEKAKDSAQIAKAETKEDLPKKDPEENLSPEQLYSKGMSSLKERNFDAAIGIFDKFLIKYPRHNLSDNAMYWKGECFYAQKDYEQAAKTFMLVTKDYPKGAKYPDALLKAGYSYAELKQTDKAKELLQQVIKQHPFSNAAPKAEAKLKQLL